ncbi:hypothetical protein [Hymenobacter metallilatus]|nr:hypothetical protein [Hymenobacter metallilatus]
MQRFSTLLRFLVLFLLLLVGAANRHQQTQLQFSDTVSALLQSVPLFKG